MKPDKEVISAVNDAIVSEMESFTLYGVFAAKLKEQGLRKLGHWFKETSKDELGHYKAWLDRLTFLGGDPDYSVGVAEAEEDPEKILKEVITIEEKGIDDYEAMYALCLEKKDAETAHLVHEILSDEEEHLRWAQKQTALLALLGKPGWLQYWS